MYDTRSHAISLRDYQTEAKNASEQSKSQRQIISLPTGSGKTIVFCSMAKNKTLILAHTDELIMQAEEKARFVNPQADLGIVKGDRREYDHQIVIASIQSISRDDRLSEMPKDFQLLVTDECHHAPANSYKKLYRHLGVLDPNKVDQANYQFNPDLKHVGFTATPFRSDYRQEENAEMDDKSMMSVFDELTYYKSILDLVSEGYLSDLKCIQVGVADLSAVQTLGGDFNQGQLSQVMCCPTNRTLILDKWMEHASDRQTLGFATRVDEAEVLAEVFSKAGIKSAYVTGAMRLEKRREIVRQYQRQEIQVLWNCQVLTEGFDDPRTDCVILGRPTQSSNLYMQMLGRGTRIHPDKENCLILDFACITDAHSIMSFPELLTGELREKYEVEGDDEKVFCDLDLSLLENAQQVAVAKTVKKNQLKEKRQDPFGRRKANKSSPKDFNWIKNGMGGWSLSLFNSQILNIYPSKKDGYDISLKQPNNPAIRLASNLNMNHAFGLAESEVQKQFGDMADVYRQGAKWRNHRPSARQIELMKELGITTDVATKGEASDLISLKLAGGM